MNRHCLENEKSPLAPLFQRGEFLPLEKGVYPPLAAPKATRGKEGFSYDYVNPIMRTLIIP
jgi:hypothetical protein